jgi:hypothetical protein
MSITFPPTLDPPNNPFQPNVEVVDPFAPTSTVKPISNPFSLGVQASCRNPSLGLMTKARGCKVAGQKGDPGVTSHALGSAKSVRE